VERRAKLLDVAAAVDLDEDALSTETLKYVVAIMNGTAPSCDPDSWRPRLAELYHLVEVDRAPRTAMHLALLADCERHHIPAPARKLNEKELNNIETAHGINAVNRGDYQTKPEHVAADKRMVQLRLAGARDRVVTRVAVLRHAIVISQQRAGFRCMRPCQGCCGRAS
jgi:hypothetical protein